jgi:hypothetical protein
VSLNQTTVPHNAPPQGATRTRDAPLSRSQTPVASEAAAASTVAPSMTSAAQSRIACPRFISIS